MYSTITRMGTGIVSAVTSNGQRMNKTHIQPRMEPEPIIYVPSVKTKDPYANHHGKDIHGEGNIHQKELTKNIFKEIVKTVGLNVQSHYSTMRDDPTIPSFSILVASKIKDLALEEAINEMIKEYEKDLKESGSNADQYWIFQGKIWAMKELLGKLDIEEMEHYNERSKHSNRN